MRRKLTAGRVRLTIAAVAAALTVSACSSGAPLDASSSAAPTGHPQVASMPDGPEGSMELRALAPSSAGADAAAGAAADSAPETLPGLSADCSSAITAQGSVNKLFADAVAASSREDEGSSTTDSAAAEASDGQSASESAGGITAEAVASTFGPIEDGVPAELADAFATLHTTAKGVVGKSAADVSDALTTKKAVAAMTTISDYIAACSPPMD